MVRTPNHPRSFVFYTKTGGFGIEAVAVPCDREQISGKIVPIVAGIAQRVKPNGLKTTIWVAMVQQLVADLLVRGDRSIGVRYGHSILVG